MKRCLVPLLCCLLLCGCAADPAPEITAAVSTTAAVTAEAPATEPAGLYAPGSALETATGGAVKAYPLNLEDCYGLAAIGDGLVVFSPADSGTNVTKLTGEDLATAASLVTEIPLCPDYPSIHITDRGISYYDEITRQTVVLDAGLREISRISVPQDLIGYPLLSAGRETLYYCTGSAICAMDTDSGICKVLKQISSDDKSVTGLWLGDTVLECTVCNDNGETHTLFLSTETGMILNNRTGLLELTAPEDTYYAAFYTGAMQTLLFGQAGGEPTALVPRNLDGSCTFLPQNHAAVILTGGENDRITLDYYDLESGLRASCLTLESEAFPLQVVSGGDGVVWILIYDDSFGCYTIYRWDTAALPTEDATVYTGTYYTRDNPDTEGLAQCQAWAEEIGSRYGISVLIWEDAVRVQPWDYDMEPEYLVPLIRQELEQLEVWLGNYPDGFLETLARNYDSLTICLVRQLTGTAESGSLETATGIQFWQDYNAYIALAVGQETEHALYHELCHLIDTQVINKCGAYDSWDSLNPQGFAYDYDYIANQSRDGSEYLQDETRAFIDTYSMSFPKEDRARIMEYAMTQGNDAYFQSPTMQAKLKQLCVGIRKAFGLTRSPDTFLWEQYLTESLAYQAS